MTTERLRVVRDAICGQYATGVLSAPQANVQLLGHLIEAICALIDKAEASSTTPTPRPRSKPRSRSSTGVTTHRV